MHPFGGVDGDADLLAQIPDGLDMVGMVMRDQYGYDLIEIYTMILQYLLYGADTDAGIYQYAEFGCPQIVTIATTSAGQTQKR